MNQKKQKYLCISALASEKRSNQNIWALYTTNRRILFWLSILNYFFDLTFFYSKAREEIQKYFLSFLVQMKTSKFAFEIYWPFELHLVISREKSRVIVTRAGSRLVCRKLNYVQFFSSKYNSRSNTLNQPGKYKLCLLNGPYIDFMINITKKIASKLLIFKPDKMRLRSVQGCH